jgi:hypothetical protein
MGGDLVARVLQMAREIRRGEANYSPHELYTHSLGRADLYSHAMQEAGYVVPSDTHRAPAVCPLCGYDFGSDGPQQIMPHAPEAEAVAYADLTPDERAAIDAWRRTR